MERSLEAATVSNRSADVPTKKRDSSSKDRNKNSARNFKTNRQRSRSVTENSRQNDARYLHEVSNISLDLSQLCKPLCVHLSRLPDSVISKYAPPPALPPVKKKHRLHLWKRGVLRRKKQKRKTSRIFRKASQNRQLPADEKISRVSDPVSSSKFKSTRQSTAGEKLGEEINGTENKECGDIGGFISRDETLSERKSSTTEAKVSHSSDQINILDFSINHQTNMTKSPDKPQNEIENANNTFATSLEHDNERNFKTRKDQGNEVILKHAKKRRLSSNGNASKEKTRLRSKKYKSSTTVSSSEGEMPAEGVKNSSLENDVASDQREKVLPQEVKKPEGRSVRSRRKLSGSNLNEAMIFVNRLDSSHSPLVQKWKDKVGLPNANDSLTSTVTRPESRVGCVSKDQHEECGSENSTACLNENVPDDDISGLSTDTGENHTNILDTSKSMNGATGTCTVPEVNRPRPPEKETIHIETIMCDSNDDDDEDDDEIMEFLSTRRRIRPSIDSSSSESTSNIEERRKTQSSRIQVKTPLMKGSSYEIRSHQERRKTPSISQEEIRKTPSFRKRRTEDWIDNSNLENRFSRDELRSRPITRSKSRAAIENTHCGGIFCSNEDLTDQSREHGTYDMYEPSKNYEAHNNEELSINGSRKNIPSPEECELNRENNNSLEAVARIHSDVSRIDAIATECSRDENSARRNFTALKNAIVVLTRLEDLIDLSEDKETHPRGKLKFKATKKFGFLAYFSPESLENDDIDAESVNSGSSIPNIDPLETESSLINETSNSALSSPRKLVNVDLSTTDCSKNKSQLDTIITRSERLQDQSENRCHETIESDVELSLFFDEADMTSPESVTCNLPEGILTDSNGSKDRSPHSPGASCPEDLDEHCKRCHCEEHQRDNKRLNCQNISATHKCITCNSLFKDAGQLEQHRTSNAFCNSGFRCTVCKTNYMTLIELAKHRVVCAEKVMRKRSSVDQISTQESLTESRIAESTISEPPQSKSKPKKQQSQKNSSKQSGRSRPRFRVDNLTCSVCSTNFETRSDLSEHIFKHSAEELQEAYRIAKAKAMEDSQVANEKRKENESKNNSDELTDIQVIDGKTSADETVENPAQELVSSVGSHHSVTTTFSNDLLATSATVCLCHRDNDQTPMDTTDLQIEMVLLCKYCHVLFRRRECLEVHYRTSNHCASDRTRQRWARLFCANCQLILHSWADMRRHLEVHARKNSEGTVRFVCNICRVVFVGFGALFYNHWFNHLKDTMFVAGRYNFPKVSVQPIDGSEKLPAGARSDESYIFVAEHVCTSCKKPFSTRRDLETHIENSNSCRRNNLCQDLGKGLMSTDVPRLFCNVCNLTFLDKKALNDHGKTGHDHRFVHVSSSPSSNNQNFMCTHCSERKKSVRDLEEHWKTHLVNNPRMRPVETAKAQSEVAKEPVLVTSSVDDDQILKNQSSNACTTRGNGVTPTQTITTHEPTVITIEDEEFIPESTASVFQAATETPIVRTDLDTRESVSVPSISSTEPSPAAINSTTLNDLLKKAPSMINVVKNHRAEVQVLEDSSENARLSGQTSTDVSPSLVLNEPSEKSQEITVNDTGTHALLPNKSSLGSLKMVRSKRRGINAAEKSTSPPTSHKSCEINGKTTIDELSSSIAAIDCIATFPVIKKSVTDKTSQRGLNAASETNTKGKENNYSSKVVEKNKSHFSPTSLHKDRSVIPEIIDIIDEVEELQGQETASNVNKEMEMQHNHPDLLNKKKGNTGVEESGNSCLAQLDKDLESIKIDGPPHSDKMKKASNKNASGSEMSLNTGNGPIRDRLNFYSRASKASTISFEEARWMTLAATNLNDSDSAVSQKQGFLRVKNLSELRAVKKHICLACDARFESHKSLVEHQQVHMCGVLDKDVQYPKGITAALVLPDSSERPKTPRLAISSSNTQSVSAPMGQLLTSQDSHASQLIGVLSSHSAVETLTPNVVVSNDSIGSWVRTRNQQGPISVPRVETANTMQNVSLLMDLGSQQQVNNSLNNLMSPIIISSTSIAQGQDNYVIQQTPTMSSVGTMMIPETNQRLHENRTGSVGFHVLPPMVVLPSSQTTKQQIQQQQQQHNLAHLNSSSNYLPTSGNVNNSPLTYQSDGANKLLCNICHTFQCDNLEAFNSHVTKHYTGWANSTMAQNFIQPSTAATTTTLSSSMIPTTTSFTMRQNTGRSIIPDITTETNQVGSSIFNNWTVKNTPHGPLLVTPVSAAISEQTMTSFVTNNNRSILRPTLPTANNNLSLNGQIVYRCMICKSALYKNYPPLRNHVILVHGITDFASRGVENIVKKSYHCTQCPTTTALFDTEEKFRSHVDNIHTHVCPSCRRVFVSLLSLKSHQEHCRLSASNDRNAFGNKC